MANQKFLIHSEFTVDVNRASLNQSLQEIKRKVDGTNATVNIKFKSNAPDAIGQAKVVTKELRNIGSTAERVNSRMRALGAELGGYFTRFTAFTFAASTVFKLLRFIEDAKDESIAFDNSLVRIAQTLNTTRKNLTGLTDEIFRLSTSFGVSSKELTEASLTIAQAGFSAEETRKSLDVLAKTAVAPSFKDMGNTIQGIIAIMHQFGIQIDDIEGKMDAINEVSKKYTVEAEDIISAVRIAGGVFAAASGDLTRNKQSFEEFISLFTAIKDTTQESAETIAQAIKTISARLQRPKTTDFLESLGIKGIRDEVTGEFAGVFKALEAISRGTTGLSSQSIEFAQIVEQLGGVRQFGKVIPAILQFGKAQEVLGVTTQSTNSLLRDQLVSQDALARSITKAREEWVKLLVAFSQNEDIRALGKFILDLSTSLARLSGTFQTLLPYLTILGFAKGLRTVGALTQGAINKSSRINPNAFASGGYVGIGSGNKDDVPAVLTKGEYVLRKEAVKDIGLNVLERVNNRSIRKFSQGGFVQGFAEGGPVRPLSGAALNSALAKLFRDADRALDEKLLQQVESLNVGDIEILPKDLVQLKIPQKLIQQNFLDSIKKAKQEAQKLSEDVLFPSAVEPLKSLKFNTSGVSKQAKSESVRSETANLIQQTLFPSLKKELLQVGDLSSDVATKFGKITSELQDLSNTTLTPGDLLARAGLRNPIPPKPQQPTTLPLTAIEESLYEAGLPTKRAPATPVDPNALRNAKLAIGNSADIAAINKALATATTKDAPLSTPVAGPSILRRLASQDDVERQASQLLARAGFDRDRSDVVNRQRDFFALRRGNVTGEAVSDFIGLYPTRPTPNAPPQNFIGSFSESFTKDAVKERTQVLYDEIRGAHANLSSVEAYTRAQKQATSEFLKTQGAYTRTGKIQDKLNQVVAGVTNGFNKTRESLNRAGSKVKLGTAGAIGGLLLSQSDLGSSFFGKSQSGVAAQSALGGALTGGLIGLDFGPAGAAIGAIGGAAVSIAAHLKQLEESLAEQQVSKSLEALSKRVDNIKFGTNVTPQDTTTVVSDALKLADIRRQQNTPGIFAGIAARAGVITDDLMTKTLTENYLKYINPFTAFQDETGKRTGQLADEINIAERNANITTFAPIAEQFSKLLSEKVRLGLIKSVEDVDKQIPDFFKVQSLSQTGYADSDELLRIQFQQREIRKVNNEVQFGELQRQGSTLGLNTVIRNRGLETQLLRQHRVLSDPSSLLPQLQGIQNIGTIGFQKALGGLGLSREQRGQASQLNLAVGALPRVLSQNLGKDYLENFQQKLQEAGVSFEIAGQLAGALVKIAPNAEKFQLEMQNAPDLMNKLVGAIDGNIKPLQDLAKNIDQLNQKILSEFQAVLSGRASVADAFTASASAGAEVNKLQRSFAGLTPTAGGDAARFRSNIRATTGTDNVSDLIKKISGLDASARSSGDARFAAAANSATEALKKFTDVTSRTTDIQNKLNALESSRSSKISLGERLLSTTGEEGTKLRTGLISARGFVESGADIRSFTKKQQLSIIEGLRGIGGGILPGINKTGTTLADEAIEKLFGIKGSTEDTERINLQQQLIAAQKESAAASRFLAEREASIFNDFLSGLQAENNRFLSLYGGKGAGFAAGGFISGFGGGDVVPARLERGEYVLNKNAVKRIGVKNLNRMNLAFGDVEPERDIIDLLGGRPVRMQSGGLVDFNTNFGANIQRLTDAIANMPRTITIEGRHTVEVIHNGVQMFQNLEPSVQKLIEFTVEQALNKMIRQKFPDVGGFTL